MSNSKRRKTKVETLPIVSESRRTQRRLVGARLHGRPLRVKATKLPRRQFLHLAAGAAALPAVSRIARAQTYPSRSVRIVVGYPAGGVTDIFARLVGQSLSERLGRPFIIENRQGASGITSFGVPLGASSTAGMSGAIARRAERPGRLLVAWEKELVPVV